MSLLPIKHNLLRDVEEEIRKIHGQIIVGVAHNVLFDPDRIPEMKQKYLKYHPNTNSKDTIRPPRIYMDDKEAELAELRKELKDSELSDDDCDEDNRCIFMVRVNRKIRQCKHIKGVFTDFCVLHEDEILYPFGLKKIVKDKNDFLSSDEEYD